MRTGTGTQSSSSGSKPRITGAEAGDDRVYSVDGGSTRTVSSFFPEAQNTDDCITISGQAGAGTAPVQATPWFEPVADNGCVDGVCPVPWATMPSRLELQPVSVAPKAKNIDKLTNPKDIVGVRKAPMSTVPANVLAEIGVAMLEGSVKYGRHNYRVAGVRSSVYYDGLMRHMMSWWEGEDIDPDSGMNHITKALSCLVVLRDAQMQEMCTDDRPPKAKEFYGNLHKKSGLIIDKHADRNPKHYTELS